MSIEIINGFCPKCREDATIYKGKKKDEGHIYCKNEDECGWIYRHLKMPLRYANEQ